MKKVDNNSINPQPPTDFTGIETSEPAKAAAGVKAVYSSLRHVFGAMPVGRGLKTLLNLNQKGALTAPVVPGPTLTEIVQE